MEVQRVAAGLALTIPQLFIRAHRAYGGTDRSHLNDEIREFERSGTVPTYVSHFIAAYDRHGDHLKPRLQLVVNNEA